MKIFTAGDGSTYWIDQLFEQPIEVNQLILTESLGGSLPTIVVKLRTSDDNPLIPLNQLLSGWLQTKEGVKINFKCFPYNVTRNLKTAEVHFVCCEPRFVNGIHVTKYNSIDDALTSMWGLSRVDSVKTDIVRFEDPYYIYQRGVTNYALCTKLCKAYKFFTVFGYTFAGLRLIDLKNSEIVGTLNDQVDIKLTTNSSWGSPKLYAGELTETPYSDGDPKSTTYWELDDNHSNLVYYDNIVSVDNHYATLIGNYISNTKLETSKNISNFTTTKLFPYQVGDKLKINSRQLNFVNPYLYRRVITCERSKITVDYAVTSYETLPTMDVTSIPETENFNL